MLFCKLALWRLQSGCRLLPHNRCCSYYAVLGVKQDASTAEIKAAYIDKCQKFHPDKHTKEQEKEISSKFVEVQQAYSVLSKPESKEVYDMVLSGRPNTGRHHPGRHYPGRNTIHMDDDDFPIHRSNADLPHFRNTVVYRILRNISVFLILLWISTKAAYKMKIYRMQERCRLRDKIKDIPVNIRIK